MPVTAQQKQPLYKQLADDLQQDIQQGLYISGHKVPSVRQLSQLKSVSISTVNQAYALLEDRGLIKSRPQSGYFVREGALDEPLPPPMSSGGLPSEVSKADLIGAMLAGCNTPDNLNLGAAIPDQTFMPYKSLQTHIQKATRFNHQDVFNYQFAPGYEPLRTLIAQRMRHSGVRCHPDEIVITNGCSEAISLCLQVSTQAGDIVAVESPCYYGLLQQLKIKGLKVIEIPTDPQTGISLEALTLALQEWPIKLLALSSRYSNPTGASLPESKQQKLIELCHQNDVTIIDDDIYGDLGYEDNNSVLKRFDQTGNVMHCSSFSKTLSPGLRLGWCLPGKRLQPFVQAQTFTSFSPASLFQVALSSYLQYGHYDKHLRRFQAQAKENTQKFSQVIKQYFPQGTRLSVPKGGFTLWVCMPSEISAIKLHQQALQAKISVVPGDIFSNTEQFSSYIRINCALPWSERVSEGLKILGDLAKNQLTRP